MDIPPKRIIPRGREEIAMGYSLRLFTSAADRRKLAFKAVPDAKGDSNG
jgi:hypothetical protein